MKSILRLNVEFAKDKATKEINFSKALKQLKSDAYDLIKSKRLTIINESYPDEVLVEYDDKDKDIKKCFLKSDSVAIIDLYFEPIKIDKLSAKEELMQDLARKMNEIKFKSK